MSAYPKTLLPESFAPPLKALILDVAAKLLSAATADHAALRAQLSSAQISRVELTGAGFFAEFSWDQIPARITARRAIGGDVGIEVSGLQHGAGALICVTEGLLDFVEAYTHGDEAWPDEADVRSTELRLALPIDNR